MRRMRRVVVTPTGRKRYLELLYRHLRAQRDEFDSWELWLNTGVPEDVAYAEHLADTEPWIALVRRDDLDPRHFCEGGNIFRFFERCEPDSVYLRLDDDVVYLSPGFVRDMFEFREAHPEYYLVYANIINNAIIAHLHKRAGRVWYPAEPMYQCMDSVGWKDPAFAETLHRAFLADATAGNEARWKLDDWILWPAYGERVSINCISWIGSPGPVGQDEEQWLSVDYPASQGWKNVIHGGAICSHFAFFTQRDHLDATDLLARYAALAPALAPALPSEPAPEAAA